MDAVTAQERLPRVGDTIDRYRVMGLVATGGMAAVYAAQRTSIGGFNKLLALKVMLPHLVTDRYFVDMFLDEARIASQIHHANVVQVFDVVEHLGLPCIVMEYLRGKSVSAATARAAERDAPLSHGMLLQILSQTATGLSGAHTTRGKDGEPLGIVHRDVSPQNTHIGYEGHVKVVDFGIAAARGRLSSTRAGELKGKLAYLAPEQITDPTRVTDRADVWGLGVMAWELLTNERLFADENDGSTMWNVVHKTIPDIGERVVGLDPEVCRCIMDCLERDPSRRTVDAAEAARVFARASVGIEPADIGAKMLDLFGDRKREEDQELERTLSSVAAQTDRESDVTDGDPPERPAPTVSAPVGQSRAWVVGVVGTAAGAAALVALASTGADSVERVPDPVDTQSVHSIDEAAPPRTVTITVENEARMVLIDGVRHDERPVIATIPADGTAKLEVITASGEVISRSIGPAEPEIVIDASAPENRAVGESARDAKPASPRPHTRPSRRKARRPVPDSDQGKAEPSKRLLPNPY